MTVDRELFDSLREGDVVRFRKKNWPRRSFAEGPIRRANGGDAVFCCEGQLFFDRLDFLQIIEHARGPFYKNVDYPEPLPGDVATYDSKGLKIFFITTGWWITIEGDSMVAPPGQLTLLYRQP
jgi:hypothetical protein